MVSIVAPLELKLPKHLAIEKQVQGLEFWEDKFAFLKIGFDGTKEIEFLGLGAMVDEVVGGVKVEIGNRLLNLIDDGIDA